MTDLDLALSYVPRPQRFRLADLFALDAALGNVVRTTREPMVGRIKLAWWRERLEEIDEGIVPAEPQLQATARLVAETSLTGVMLAELAERWEPLLDDFPWGAEVASAIAARGAMLFDFASAILGADQPDPAMDAGTLWALADVARHCSDADSRSLLVDVARSRLAAFGGGTIDVSLRPLTMLGLLARRELERWPDIEAEATPGRAWVMIRHRLTGKV
jgi:15-cis-phytoene synthase